MLEQLVEGVEKLLLGAFFAAEDLDVVDQQHVGRAVVPVERLHAVELDAVDHLVHEALAGDVDDLHAGVVIHQRAADGVHQVRLAHAHAAVDEQRIVDPGGHGGHGLRRGMGELIAGSHHEGIEGETSDSG